MIRVGGVPFAMDGQHRISSSENVHASSKIVSINETYVARRGDGSLDKPWVPPLTVERPLPLRTRSPKKRRWGYGLYKKASQVNQKNATKRPGLLDRPVFSSLLAFMLIAAIFVIIVYFIWNPTREPIAPLNTPQTQHFMQPTSPGASVPATASHNDTTQTKPNDSTLTKTDDTQVPEKNTGDGQTEQPSRGDATLSPTPSTLPKSEGPEESLPTHVEHDKVLGERIYTVQPGDTLYRIAMKTYGNKASIETIRAANGLKDNTIYVGQELKLPARTSSP